MGKLSEEEVAARDEIAPCYDYYKPMPGQEYKGLSSKRTHYCERCKTEGLLAPDYFWKGRGCQNCSTKRGKGQQFDDAEVLRRDSKASCSKSYPPDPNQPYIGQYQKRTHTCTECGSQGTLTAKSFWNGTGCPSCGAKKGSKNKIENAKAESTRTIFRRRHTTLTHQSASMKAFQNRENIAALYVIT